MAIEKSSKVSLLLAALLVLGMVSTIQLASRGSILPKAAAESIDYSNLADADRRVVYLAAHRPDQFRIGIENGGAMFGFLKQKLPDGIAVTPSSTTAAHYTIRVNNDINVSPEQLPLTVGLNFYDINDTDKTASITLVIDSIDTTSRQPASVIFDKQTYTRGEIATITVKDPRVDCLVPDQLPDSVKVKTRVLFNGILMPAVILPRDPDSNNEFRQSFSVPNNVGTLEVRYHSDSDCSFPPIPTGPSDYSYDKASVVQDKISFDKTNYGYQDNVVMTVQSSSGTARPIQISANTTSSGIETRMAVSGAARSIIPTPSPTGNLLVATVPIRDLFDAANIGDSGFATITATYGGVNGAQTAATVIPDRKTIPVIPEGRTSFLTNDTASIEVLSPEWNTDPLNFDTNFMTICSYEPGVGQPIDGGRTVISMAETGRNTGIFVNSYFVSFIDPNFDIQSLPDEDREMFANTTVRVLADHPSALLFKQRNQDCPFSLPSSTPTEPVTIVEPSVTSDPDVGGRGQNSGATPHTTPPLYTVSQVNCNQYNYGPDSDGDGLCDNWETTTGVKVYYPAGGSSWTLSYTNDPAPKPDHKDIFVELDYVNNLNLVGCNDGRTADGNNYKPNTAAVDNVEAAFRGAPVTNDDGVNGVELHIYIDDPVNNGVCWEDVKVFGENTQTGTHTFDEIKQASFGRDTSELLSTNKGKAKFQVFHYALSIPRQTQDMPSSGVSELLGNDLVVSLGASGIGWSDANMGGTIMHELGHNLGLYHGGPPVTGNDYNVNCKPNYPSVMTYIRQLPNPYSNATLVYSDDVLSPASISGTNPSEPGSISQLKLTSSSWMSLVELVWGITPSPPPNGPIVLSGDSTQTPSIKGDVRKTNSDIDWNGDGSADASDSPPGNNIINVGISGCSGGPDSSISGADDWANLKLDFRTLNPDAFSTGFGDPQYLPLEVNSTIVTQIREKGIETTDYLFDNLDDSKYVQHITCSDSVSDIEPRFPYSAPQEHTFTITDSGADKNNNTIDVIPIKITSTSDPVGISLSAQETSQHTGIFTRKFDTIGTMNSTGTKIRVSNGDKVIVQYTDSCVTGPTKIGSDFALTFTIGGNYSGVEVEEIATIPEKVNSEVHSKLVSGSLLGGESYLLSTVTNTTLLKLIDNYELEPAEQELLGLRKYIDGSAGGNKTDDLYTKDWETIRARVFLDDVLASLIESNLSDTNRTQFKVFSYDVRCTNDNSTNVPCEIDGAGDSITSTTNTFKIEKDKKRVTLDLAGQGNVTLKVPIGLTTNGTFSFVRSFANGAPYDFDMLSQNSSDATIVLQDLSLHPRNMALFYGPDLVSPLPLSLLDINGSQVNQPKVGDQVILATNLTNFGSWDQNFTALVEVRNADGVTMFLAWQSGTLNPDGELGLGLSWIPEEAGVYTLRVFILSDLEHPEVLSAVRTATITVNP